jgi:hypothetical protein
MASDLINQKGFFRGTIAMIVVSASLAAWILVVVWQDKRTAHLKQVASLTSGKKDDEEKQNQQADKVVFEQTTARNEA